MTINNTNINFFESEILNWFEAVEIAIFSEPRRNTLPTTGPVYILQFLQSSIKILKNIFD